MKIFQHANVDGKNTCLICKKPKDTPVVLIGVVGTEDDGIMEARQVHVSCIDLLYYPEHSLIAQKTQSTASCQKLI